MRKRFVIVHGWDGSPEAGWFPWLGHELEALDCDVIVPQLPFPAEPRIDRWVPALANAVGVVDEQTFFIGYSMGCQTIARFLAGLPQDQISGGVVFVAGFFTKLTNLEDDDVVRDVAKEWLETSLDFSLVRAHIKKSVAIFSDNDQYVPLENKEVFVNEIGSRVIIEHDRGHFSGSQGVTEVPSVLDACLES